MTENGDYIELSDVPEEFQTVQCTLDKFVEVNYNSARDTIVGKFDDITSYLFHCQAEIVDIIRNNPPLATVPDYFCDGRDDYLWYSDFYDDITKDALRKYQNFSALVVEVTPSNYAEELAKIDLPYFKELVNLVSLERLCMDYEVKEIEPEIESTPEAEVEPDSTPILEPSSETLKAEEILPATKKRAKDDPDIVDVKDKISYEPNMTSEQCSLLVKGLEDMRLFSRVIKIRELKKLLNGQRPLFVQVMNQNSFVYLFDELSKAGYIKSTWTSVAHNNKDFRSFPRGKDIEKYGEKGNVLDDDRINPLRIKRENKFVHNLDAIEDLLAAMGKCK